MKDGLFLRKWLLLRAAFAISRAAQRRKMPVFGASRRGKQVKRGFLALSEAILRLVAVIWRRVFLKKSERSPDFENF